MTLTGFFCFMDRLVFLLNIVELVSELEDSLRRVEVILIQQPGLTANLKDIQHQIKVLQVASYSRVGWGGGVGKLLRDIIDVEM